MKMSNNSKKNRGRTLQIIGGILMIAGFVLFIGPIFAVAFGQFMSIFSVSMVGFILFVAGSVLSSIGFREKNKADGTNGTPIGNGSGFVKPDEGFSPDTFINDDRNRSLQGSIVCPKCGRINNPGSRFCDQCGSPLVKICPHCHAENNPGDSYCSKCGEKLDEKQ